MEDNKKENFDEINIEMKDFGQISKGTISLKPLTIFIGSNNSGKSYGAMLIHSIFESHNPSPNFFNKQSRARNFYPLHLNPKVSRKKLDSESITQLTERIRKLEENQEIEIPSELTEEVIPEIINQWFKNRLSNELKFLFSSQLSDLNRIVDKRTKPFQVSITTSTIDVKIKNLKGKCETVYKLNKNPKIIIKCSSKDTAEEPQNTLDEIFFIVPQDIINKLREELIESFIYTACESYVSSQFSKPCYYLPASRSGILQNNRPLIAGIMSNMSFYDVGDNLVSGIIIKFLSTVINLPNKKGEFFEIVQDFENELIQGNIDITNTDNIYSPTIKYNFKNTEIPLLRSSSTVSELAPIFLYLKYLAKPNTFLIIEEPEAHLHPKNIRILARLFVKLIRKNVHVLITTHSDYLLEQLSNFIKLSKIDPQIRKSKFNYDEEDYLNSNEVSGYVFKESKKLKGTEIIPIEIDDGLISQEEFVKIRNILYEEIIKIDDILDCLE